MIKQCKCETQEPLVCLSCYSTMCKECAKVIKRGNRRNPASQKYRMVKKMKHRAITFKIKAKTKEEEKAWQKVIEWLEGILHPENRVTTARGAIGLKSMKDEP